jgi:hypothetical protein
MKYNVLEAAALAAPICQMNLYRSASRLSMTSFTLAIFFSFSAAVRSSTPL